MRIKHLKLHHFRNYEDKEFDFEDQSNLILGPNGSGKTSLLEALYFLALGRSFRTSLDQTLLKFSHEDFFVRGGFLTDQNRSLEIVCSLDKKKVIKINRKTAGRLSDLIGLVPVIVFLDKDTALVDGAPGLRRKFMDILFSQVDRNYFLHLVRYHHMLKERNFYLKNGPSDPVLLESLDEGLIDSGSRIVLQRINFFQKLSSLFCRERETYASGWLSGLTLEYHSSLLSSDRPLNDPDPLMLIKKLFKSALLENRSQEERLKYTISGPHRDDIMIYRTGSVRFADYSSAGEKRLFAVLLKMAELGFLKEFVREKPVLLMDDIMLELDEKSRAILLLFLSQVPCQVMISAVDEKDYSALPALNRIIL